MLTWLVFNDQSSPSASYMSCILLVIWKMGQPFSVSSFTETIKDLFPDGSISSSTKLVLVNTVYFKGQWDREFKKENTKEEKFWMNKVCSLIFFCDVLTHGI